MHPPEAAEPEAAEPEAAEPEAAEPEADPVAVVDQAAPAPAPEQVEAVGGEAVRAMRPERQGRRQPGPRGASLVE
jgi:hypothetical protein